MAAYPKKRYPKHSSNSSGGEGDGSSNQWVNQLVDHRFPRYVWDKDPSELTQGTLGETSQSSLGSGTGGKGKKTPSKKEEDKKEKAKKKKWWRKLLRFLKAPWYIWMTNIFLVFTMFFFGAAFIAWRSAPTITSPRIQKIKAPDLSFLQIGSSSQMDEFWAEESVKLYDENGKNKPTILSSYKNCNDYATPLLKGNYSTLEVAAFVLICGCLENPHLSSIYGGLSMFKTSFVRNDTVAIGHGLHGLDKNEEYQNEALEFWSVGHPGFIKTFWHILGLIPDNGKPLLEAINNHRNKFGNQFPTQSLNWRYMRFVQEHPFTEVVGTKRKMYERLMQPYMGNKEKTWEIFAALIKEYDANGTSDIYNFTSALWSNIMKSDFGFSTIPFGFAQPGEPNDKPENFQKKNDCDACPLNETGERVTMTRKDAQNGETTSCDVLARCSDSIHLYRSPGLSDFGGKYIVGHGFPYATPMFAEGLKELSSRQIIDEICKKQKSDANEEEKLRCAIDAMAFVNHKCDCQSAKTNRNCTLELEMLKEEANFEQKIKEQKDVKESAVCDGLVMVTKGDEVVILTTTLGDCGGSWKMGYYTQQMMNSLQNYYKNANTKYYCNPTDQTRNYEPPKSFPFAMQNENHTTEWIGFVSGQNIMSAAYQLPYAMKQKEEKEKDPSPKDFFRGPNFLDVEKSRSVYHFHMTREEVHFRSMLAVFVTQVQSE